MQHQAIDRIKSYANFLSLTERWKHLFYLAKTPLQHKFAFEIKLRK